MFPKSNEKSFPQYENNYKKAFFNFFNFLTSETGVDEAKRKFILECFERFKDTEEYDSIKDFFLDVFEEIGSKSEAADNFATNDITTITIGKYGAANDIFNLLLILLHL